MPKQPAWLISAIFFFLGFFTSTWDLLLTVDLGGFTLKAHQAFFFVSFLAALSYQLRCGRALLRPLRQPFAVFVLLLAFYYGAASPRSFFPLKSALYSCWIVFNLVAIWLTAAWLASHIEKRLFAWAAWLTAGFHAVVIAIDQIAFRFGYHGGFLGFNQDALLNWGVSRPHAFSFEPSYIAAFLASGLILAYASFESAARKTRAWNAPSLVLIVFALIAATSRTGWVTAATGLAIFLALDTRRGLPIAKAGKLMGMLVVAAALFFLTTSSKQRTNLDKNLVSTVAKGTDGAGNARLRAHGYALEMARETNWLGTGLGASYKYWIATRKNAETALQPEFSQASFGNEVVMSTWGQLLAEGGITALLLYAGAGLSLLIALWRRWQIDGSLLTQASLASALVFFLFTAFFLGNVARGDVWVWFAIWSRMALPDTGEATANQRA